MDEIENPKADAASQEQDSTKGDESNSVPKYTELEYRKAMKKASEDAVAKYGDRIKRETLDPITKERDTFKTERDSLKVQFEAVKSEMSEVTKEIADLKETLETLDSEDAGRVKQIIREKQRELTDLKAQKEALAEPAKEVAKWKRDQLITSVADEYGLKTQEQLKAFREAADDLNRNTREELLAMARHLKLSVKEEVKEEVQPHVPFSSKNSGSVKDFDNMTPKEKIEYGLAHPSKK